MLKTEPIEIPLKKSKMDDYAMKSKLEDYAVKSKLEDYAMKSKLDDYAVKTKLDDYAAAYLYAAATMDPLYIHAAMYEPWPINRQFSAFRPVSNIFANNGKDTCKSEKPPRHQKYYKDQPPVLQNPERVVPLSESERFERSFQPNVALAPPLPAPPMKPNRHHLARHHNDNYNHHQTKEKIIKIEEQEYSPNDHETQKHLNVNENCPIKSNVISSKDESQCLVDLDLDLDDKETTVDGTHSAIVDSTVSVVQSIGVNMNPGRYNSEIELSTDTDDSLSDMSSDNPRKVTPDIQRVMDGLADVPMETRDRVVDIVRRMVFEHNRAMQQSHEKDERIAQLEQRVLELEANLRQATGGATSVRSSHSEYDVTVTSSRTEMPAPDECISEDIVNDSPPSAGDMHIGSSSSSSSSNCAPEPAAPTIPIICSPPAQAQAQVQAQESDDDQGIREEQVTSETIVVSPLLCKTSEDSSIESNNSIGTKTNEPE